MTDNLFLLKEAIESEMGNSCYSSHNSTLTHKLSACEAFLSLIEKEPEQMLLYFFDDKKVNILHKVFQEYISIIEGKIPFFFKKNKKNVRIESLLDSELNLFDGISVFSGAVLSQKIKNGTKEFYIGGREASYTKPFYIGKLLDVSIEDVSALSKVKEYSFNHIKIDLPDKTDVKVTHLRVPPHYQMGGMSHINRIRKAVIKKLKKE